VLFRLDVAELAQVHRLGDVTAIRLNAALELGRPLATPANIGTAASSRPGVTRTFEWRLARVRAREPLSPLRPDLATTSHGLMNQLSALESTGIKRAARKRLSRVSLTQKFNLRER
jgi:hypothetical protein